MITNNRIQKLLCAAFSATALLMAVPAAQAASALSNLQQGGDSAACAHSGLGHACAEDWNNENIAAR
jgi:hypothetical protein